MITKCVDVIGVIIQTWSENNESQRWLITKATPTITAGSRWPNLAPKIPFGYKNLEDAINNAIDESKENGAMVVDKLEVPQDTKLDFNALRAEAADLWAKLVGTENPNTEMATTILKKVEIIFGHPHKISETTEDQVALLELVVIEMRDMLQSK